MPDTDYAALFGALAKAQGAFPTITRDKQVTVQTKSGGSYTFKYAPLDKILNDTRAPLAMNGLAVTQLIDSDPDGLPYLITRLLHDSGAFIEGRTPIPHADGESVQVFGSAVTYLRRYAIQALLGIAAEEDDDGNAAAGNRATFGEPKRPQSVTDPEREGLIGTVQIGKSRDSDYELRQAPEGGYEIGFALVSTAGKIKATAKSPLAEEIKAYQEQIVGARVTAYGRIRDESFRPTGSQRTVTYQVLELSGLRVPEVGDLPAPTPEQGEAATAALFSEAEEKQIDAALGVGPASPEAVADLMAAAPSVVSR